MLYFTSTDFSIRLVCGNDMKNSHLAAIAILLFLFEPGFAGERIDMARDFLKQNQIFHGEIQIPDNFDQVKTAVKAKPDPESKFGYIVFSIARNSSSLLSEEQAKRLDDLIKKRKASPVNWHDVRNIVRVQTLIAMWDFVIEEDEAKAAQLKSKWNDWNDLRLDFMFQEFIGKERFQRSAWEILTAEQRQKLLRGDWDSYLKKNIGHLRLFAADKRARQALGNPDNRAAFDETSQKWKTKWEPMLEKYWQASRFQNRREFSMDEADEVFAIAAWSEYASAFQAFAESECDAIRNVVQAGYEIDSALAEKVIEVQENARSEMIKKYSPTASTFLRLLEEIK